MSDDDMMDIHEAIIGLFFIVELAMSDEGFNKNNYPEHAINRINEALFVVGKTIDEIEA